MQANKQIGVDTIRKLLIEIDALEPPTPPALFPETFDTEVCTIRATLDRGLSKPMPRFLAERLLLDNFTLDALAEAVSVNREEGQPPAELEASGGMALEDVAAIAATGVDYISVGALTKNVRAVDLSMRFR